MSRLDRIYKFEEWADQQVSDAVYEVITELFDVDHPDQLTIAQVTELTEWVDHNDPYLLGSRIREIIEDWHYEHDD